MIRKITRQPLPDSRLPKIRPATPVLSLAAIPLGHRPVSLRPPASLNQPPLRCLVLAWPAWEPPGAEVETFKFQLRNHGGQRGGNPKRERASGVFTGRIEMAGKPMLRRGETWRPICPAPQQMRDRISQLRPIQRV